MSLSPAGSLGSEAPPSPRYGFATTAAVTFEAPELPEETLMEVRGGAQTGGGSVGRSVVASAANVRPLLAESSRSTRTQCKACASHWTSPAV